METRTYNTIAKKKLANGTVKEYNVTKKYTVKGRPRQPSMPPEETIAEIKRQHGLGVPATKIAANTGISLYKVRQIING